MVAKNHLKKKFVIEIDQSNKAKFFELFNSFKAHTLIIDSMIVLGGAVHEKSFFKETKYDLDYLGIGHMTKGQMLDYMRRGNYTTKS